MPRFLFKALPPLTLLGAAVTIRLVQHHDALLYPDGYQYLLMARGIAEHLQQTTTLGAGGDHFVPNADAAAKPVFPLLVAIVHGFGVSWLSAARAVTVSAAAAVVVIVGLLATRLTRSGLAGAAASALVLVSPSLGFWSGFSGPDPLAQALALGAALAFSRRRARAGGLLAGLAVATRPELVAVALLGAIFAARRSELRSIVTTSAVTAALTVAAVGGVLRPPIALPDLRLVALTGLVAVAAALVARLEPPSGLIIVGGLALVGIGMAASRGLADLWHDDWPLLVVGLGSLALLAFTRAHAAIAAHVVAVATLLGAIYFVKNPELERYFALELPLAALLAALALAATPAHVRVVAFGAVAAAVFASVTAPMPGTADLDVFTSVAPMVERAIPRGDVLLTAAPDAYGFLLPSERVQALRAGKRGYVLLDAAQRAYAPELGAHGRVVARSAGDVGFTRPDGDIDPGSAVLVRGEVVARPPARR